MAEARPVFSHSVTMKRSTIAVSERTRRNPGVPQLKITIELQHGVTAKVTSNTKAWHDEHIVLENVKTLTTPCTAKCILYSTRTYSGQHNEFMALKSAFI
jgi:hypothetical protein